MTDLIWDEAGTRFYETGVSKGILFPVDGSTGVPWNGLVNVSLDTSGGEPESYFFDGTKYMGSVLAEDFQATVQAVTTPKEFDVCEGVREVKYGMKTHFNRRMRFHMAWRTEIGSDEGESVAYKWHIAYNNLTQPSARTYQTKSDNTTPDLRSFVITATPACGKDSYYSFDSRDGDLSALEAQLKSGILPKCWELATLVGPPVGGDPVPPSDDDCPSLFVDFESYNPGQVVASDVADGIYETSIFGLINNGLDITELPAAGAFAANDSAASEVGTGNILADDDDDSYITSADGDLGYTVGLPLLVGYVPGSELELHIRMSITGDVNPDDPDNLDADAQVHISTDAAGDNRIGGFSDGVDEGMGFAISAVDGTIVDYVIPLNMDAWIDLTIDDVVAALEAGAYLNVVGASNNNSNTTPEVNVYEASVFVFDATDQDKALRTYDPDDQSYVELDIYASGDSWPDTLVASCSSELDFWLKERAANADYSNYVQDLLNSPYTTRYNLMATYSSDNADPEIQWFDGSISSSVPIASFTPEYNVKYHATFDNGWTSAHLKIVRKDTEEVVLEHTHDTTLDPTAYMQFYTGYVGNGDGSKVYEVTIDNTKIQVHCHQEPPVSYRLHSTTVDDWGSGTPYSFGDIWRDDDDATYAEFGYSDTSHQISRGFLETYSGGELLSIELTFRASATGDTRDQPLATQLIRSNGGEVLRIGPRDGNVLGSRSKNEPVGEGPGGSWVIPNDGVIRTYSKLISSDIILESGWDTVDDIRSDLVDGALLYIYADEFFDNTYPTGEIRVYEARLDIKAVT